MATRRQQRYNDLRESHFTPLESRELSRLPKANPARTRMMKDRTARWERFSRLAITKMRLGKWKQSDLAGKWTANLGRYYKRMGFRVKEGPSGRQQKMAKGSPNPWAMYRWYEKQFGGPGGKPYRSPWEIRQIMKGKTLLEKGLVFVQRLEKQAERAGGLSKGMIRQWIGQKDDAIKVARGKHRVQLMIEKNRLERLLEG